MWSQVNGDWRYVVRVKVYALIQTAIETGLTQGWNRAHKHTDKPSESFIFMKQYDAILEALTEYISFDESEEQ